MTIFQDLSEEANKRSKPIISQEVLEIVILVITSTHINKQTKRDNTYIYTCVPIGKFQMVPTTIFLLREITNRQKFQTKKTKIIFVRQISI